MRDARAAALAATGVACAVIAGWLGVWASGPPPALGLEAPPEAFSAARAMATVEAIAARPRPMGTEAHEAVREHLRSRLEELGLDTGVEETTVLRVQGNGLLGARVRNLTARLSGTGRDGSVLLLAHYDTVPGSAGAGDDSSGVAAICETLRALGSGPPLARDLLVIFTDGEEVGLLGARAFAADAQRVAEVALVLNFEARGDRGAVQMFETAAGNYALIGELARAAPSPVASSLSQEVYRRMPNDTDFTVLRRAGLPGFNFAMIGGHAAYHTRLDTAERLDPRSVQHQGSYALSLARHFGELAQIPAAGADGVYFNVFGRWLFTSYSSNTGRVLATFLVAFAAWGLTVRSRRSGGRVAGSGLGALLPLAAVVAAVGAAVASWTALVAVAPGLLSAPHGVPWVGRWWVLGTALLVAAAILTLVRQLAVRARAMDLWAGALAGWTLLAVATAFFLPGAGYLFLWPSLSGWIAFSLLESTRASRRLRILVATVAALPAVTILSPVALLLLEALTVRQAGPALALLAMVATLFALPLAEITAWGRGWVALPLAVAGLSILGAAVWFAKPSEDAPATAVLFYALDADLGRAYWLSTDPRPDAWTSGYVGTEVAPSRVEILPFLRRDLLRGEAAAIDVEPPQVVFERAAGGGRLVLRLSSVREAPVLRLRLEGEEPFTLLRVDGRRTPRDLPAAAEGGVRELDLTFFAPPPEGLEIEIEPGAGRLSARLVDQSWGLPSVAGKTPRRAADRMPPASWISDSTLVSKHVVWSGGGFESATAAGAGRAVVEELSGAFGG